MARYFGRPWIIGADFQMPPDVLQQHIGTLLDETDAYIVAPSEATHRPEQGTHSTIDFIVCVSFKDHIADVPVDSAYGIYPHRAVRVTLQIVKHSFLVEEIERLKGFPRKRPIGCPRAPVILEWPCTPAGGVGGHAALRHRPSMARIVLSSRMRYESSV